MFLMKMFLSMCVIYTFEIFGTAGVGFFDKEKDPDSRKSLKGFSFIWMAPVYFLASGLFMLFFMLMTSLSWYLIVPFVYVFGLVVMTAIETGWGALLNKFLGFCPWSHYTKEQRGIFLGYSRWDWSLLYGALAVVYYYFMILFDWSLRWIQ